MNNISQVVVPIDAQKSVLNSAAQQGNTFDKGGSSLPPVQKAAKVETIDPAVYQENVEAAVAQMNEFIQSTQRDLHFSYDREAGETVVKVLDRGTQEVIRQIPNETFLELVRNKDFDGGLHLFNAQA